MPSTPIYTLSLHDALPIFGGLHGALSISSYSASKFALEGWTESLRLEVNSLGIKVVLVEPGSYQTDIWTRNAVLGKKTVDGSSDRKSTRLNSSHPSISYAVYSDLHSFPTRRSSDLRRPSRCAQHQQLFSFEVRARGLDRIAAPGSKLPGHQGRAGRAGLLPDRHLDA